MLWQLSLGMVPGSCSAGGPGLTGGPTNLQGTLPCAQGLRLSGLRAAHHQLPKSEGPPSHRELGHPTLQLPQLPKDREGAQAAPRDSKKAWGAHDSARQQGWAALCPKIRLG